jgi:hypothetical protein
MRSLA